MASIDTACPANCDTPLGTFSFSACGGEFNQAQINYLYIMNADYPLVDWSNPGEWATRLALTTEANAIRRLTVLGSLGDPTRTLTKRSAGRTSYSPFTFNLTADIDEDNNTNYDAVRQFGCNGSYRIYYSTLGGKLYDPNAIASINSLEPITANDEDIVVLKLSVQWTENKIPLRITNPIA